MGKTWRTWTLKTAQNYEFDRYIEFKVYFELAIKVLFFYKIDRITS